MSFIENNNRLEKVFEFNNFGEALEFVNKLGEIFEAQNHHPDVSLFDYKFVKVSTTTHSAGNTITQQDRDIVELIDNIK